MRHRAKQSTNRRSVNKPQQRNIKRRHNVHTVTKRSVTSWKPQVSPYQGMAEFTSSKKTLHVPTSESITMDDTQITKIANLAYLVPHLDDESSKATQARLNKTISWLSSITHINTDELPCHNQQYTKTPQLNEKDLEVAFNPTFKIPFYSPLELLASTVPPSHVHTNTPIVQLPRDVASSLEVPPSSTTPPLASADNLLRLRPDIAVPADSVSLLRNAPYTDLNFFVAPKSNNNDE